MMSSADTQVVTESAVDAGLRHLVERGYQFMQSTDEHGEIAAVVGVRGHDNVIDVIQIESEDHVVASRMPGHENNVLAPANVWWRSTGEASKVIEELLDLPDDRTPGALILPTQQATAS